MSIESDRELIEELRAMYRPMLEGIFGDRADTIIAACKKDAPLLGNLVEAGATYAEAALIQMMKVAPHVILNVNHIPSLRMYSMVDPTFYVHAIAAVMFYVITPEEITK